MSYFLDNIMMESHQKYALMELEELENRQKEPKEARNDSAKP